MITASQLRAARALLGWSQRNVSQATSLTNSALSRIESGQVQARSSTLNRLEALFTQAGIEFLSGDGLRLRQRSVAIDEHHGPDAIATLQDDIYVTMLLAKPAEMLLIGVDERQFKQVNATTLRQQQQRLEAAGIRQKILIKDRDRFFVMPPEVATYRWIDASLFGLIPIIVYGSKVAILFWGPPIQVIIMGSSALAETYRKQFNSLWRSAQKVPFTAKEIREICEDNFAK